MSSWQVVVIVCFVVDKQNTIRKIDAVIYLSRVIDSNNTHDDDF
jgi:hypothetical protein